MSELKAGVIVTPHDEGTSFDRGSDAIAVTERETEFYLKSEADKVIAEKDAEIAQLQAMLEERNSQIAKLTQSLEQVKRAARTLRKKMYNEKRKRCLKMAELCCERKENCYNVALRKYTKSEGDKLIKKSERWEEWEDCWIQLADKFKEAK